jgi:RNA polymerase sigma-70 factor (ECF subfamily)
MNDDIPMGSPFDEVATEHRAALVRYLRRLVGDADAEDVAQTALTKASMAWGGFRGDASPKNWLFRIATHAAFDFMRGRGDILPASLPIDDEDEMPELGEDAGQERRLVREEMSTCVRGVLQRLPEGHQTILALSDCDELSDRDIATVLGLTVGAAKVRLHRARARLKAELVHACTFYRDADNVLCCDKKQADLRTEGAIENSSSTPYPSDHELRHQVESRTQDGGPENPNQELDMTTETLPSKQKHLIGVGAAVAAGCQPCTDSFVGAARSSGACERGARHAIEAGLRAREAAHGAMRAFADATFANPELDEAFRADRKMLESLIGVAAALAGNAATLLEGRVEEARRLGATDAQIRLAGQIAVTARRGAEQAAEAAFARVLGEPQEAGCCAQPGEACTTGGCNKPSVDAPAGSPCGCSS